MAGGLTQEAPTKPRGLAVWLLASRPKTLSVTLSPVLLGTAFAISDSAFHGLAFVCALVSGLLIQIGTNFANDYEDYVRGADTEFRKGPTRVTQSGMVSPQAVKRAAIITFSLAVAAGGYLIFRGGWPILVLGLVSIASGIAYTAGRYALAYTGLADLFVLAFFGPIAVGGTYYVQALTLPSYVLIAGIGPGLIAVGTLIVNNVRDINEDRAANKRTLIVRFGRRFGELYYVTCYVIAAVIPVYLISRMDGPYLSLVASAVALIFGVALAGKLRKSEDPAVLNALLGKTAMVLLVYSVAWGAGWIVG
ncbi:MAG: 1,4-dihydroxy-2-naphthoate polyprenyltransferase [Rubricoccaceae bacterium]|nr:1,4-dihydroxy-2-naphthoate polyprenyltransferase [Rubricoccaceae bacterium]